MRVIFLFKHRRLNSKPLNYFPCPSCIPHGKVFRVDENNSESMQGSVQSCLSNITFTPTQTFVSATYRVLLISPPDTRVYNPILTSVTWIFTLQKLCWNPALGFLFLYPAVFWYELWSCEKGNEPLVISWKIVSYHLGCQERTRCHNIWGGGSGGLRDTDRSSSLKIPWYKQKQIKETSLYICS